MTALFQHLARRIALEGPLTVADFMSKALITASLGDSIPVLLKRMVDNDIRHLPVVENGRLKGLITRKDALEGLYDDATLELKSLNEFVFRSDARY